MINNKYKSLHIGDNYLAYIASIIKLSKGESILQLLDSRLKYSGSWFLNISSIEKKFLKMIGLHYDIQPLCEFDKYTEISEGIYWINERQIILGNSFYRNLKELCRKLPEIFDQSLYTFVNEIGQEEINLSLQKYLDDISEYSFKYLNYQDFAEKLFVEKRNNIIDKFVDVIKNKLLEKKSSPSQLLLRQFLFVHQVKNQTFFSDSYSKFELYYLFINMIAPKYLVKQDSLSNELRSIFQSKGGHVKSAEIVDWQFYNNKLENIMLGSFEGKIEISKTLIFGSMDDRFPMVLADKYRTFSNIYLELHYQTPIFKDYAGNFLTFSNSEKLGSDFPLWQAKIEDSHKIIVKFLYPKKSGSKPEFYYDLASKEVFDSLLKIFPDLEEESFKNSLEIFDGDDIWLEKFNKNHIFTKRLVNTFNDRSMGSLVNRESQKKVRKVEFWGPERARPVGLFSYLVDLKNLCFDK